MVLFMVEMRKKEMAIRRINGAETKDIIFLFVMNFARIIVYSSITSIPVCFFILQKWIQTYAYRTSLGWWIFIFVPIVVTLITVVGISLQVFMSSRQNPAEIIKSST